jgi:hypothetical protein
MTKRELIELLEEYDDDIQVEVGIEGGEAGTQFAIIDTTYVTGVGRGVCGGTAVILEHAERTIEGFPPNYGEEEGEGDEAEMEMVECPHCKKSFNLFDASS